ncbi:hypothetical protein PIB30_087440, partial [Stylosanthes scabra]|nr:hypothetical protein [Stylosanthes scabra]
VSKIEGTFKDPKKNAFMEKVPRIRDLCNIHSNGHGLVMVEDCDGFVFGHMSGVLEEQDGGSAHRSCKVCVDYYCVTRIRCSLENETRGLLRFIVCKLVSKF